VISLAARLIHLITSYLKIESLTALLASRKGQLLPIRAKLVRDRIQNIESTITLELEARARA
jgi:hypothetical protein